MFKHAVKVTVANVEYLLDLGYTIESAIQEAMFLVELPEWVAQQVKQAVQNKFMEVM